MLRASPKFSHVHPNMHFKQQCHITGFVRRFVRPNANLLTSASASVSAVLVGSVSLLRNMASNGASERSSAAASSGQRDDNLITQTFPSIVELNVGGVFYTTSLSTLTKKPDCLLGQMFTGRSKTPVLRDSKGKFFIDRDGVLFRYILDYLRNQKLVLPENFSEKERLRAESIYFELGEMLDAIDHRKVVLPLDPFVGSEVRTGCITIGYRGSFAFGGGGMADVKFRKLNRILVCGRVSLCREVFGDTLNESRDPDRGQVDRYSARFFLKHFFLEQAFDMLIQAGYRCVGSCGTSTSGAPIEMKPGMDNEEERWSHYNEIIWTRV